MDLSLSILGWLHTAACVAALGLGGWLIVRRKGTRRHRQLGDAYVVSLLFASFTSLGIYTRHAFTAAHWFAVIAIVLSVAGFSLGRWKRPAGWRYLHLTCMLGSYYVLVGGGVNEVYLRVKALRPIFFHQRQVVGMTHGLVMLAFILLIAGFLIATFAGRPKRRAAETAQLAKAA